jgi:hypothetical protein
MIQKFTKKPVTIEAMQWTGKNHREMFDFLTWNEFDKQYMTGSGEYFYIDHSKVNGGLVIKTLEGEHIATIGDYIIKGVKGEFYPCKPDIFEMTYSKQQPPISGERRGKDVLKQQFLVDINHIIDSGHNDIRLGELFDRLFGSQLSELSSPPVVSLSCTVGNSIEQLSKIVEISIDLNRTIDNYWNADVKTDSLAKKINFQQKRLYNFLTGNNLI